MSQNPVQERRSKHIDIKYHHVRECVETGKISLFFIEGTENPADMFTKNLGAAAFFKCLKSLGLEFKDSKTISILRLVYEKELRKHAVIVD